MEYAASDISELPQLHSQLEQRLAELQRSNLMNDVCRELLLPQFDPPAKLDVESFRNAWQLASKNQAALAFLIEWHNSLPPRERAKAPANKTLLALASRLPKTPQDLLRIKGVPPYYAGKTAGDLVRGMNAAAKRASAGDFPQLEPPPYATFEEILLDAWLASLRAEVCAQAEIAPDLAFPARHQRSVKQLMLERQEAGVVLEQLSGWRQQVLAQPTEQFMRRHPPPFAPH
jgi:ribonuclease D